MPIRRLEDTLTATTATVEANDLASTALASVEHVKPHIQPGVLYPGISDKQLDGTTALAASTVGPNSSTVTSSKYGTVQSDGRMYYYTDIKGSKPIKDPRIGGHFGGQRHKFKSIQLLEQETAIHGDKVYSIDGRKWARAYGDDIEITNESTQSESVTIGNGNHIEIVGYFRDMNLCFVYYDGRNTRYTLDGGTENTTDIPNSIIQSPIDARFLDASSVFNLGLSTTLGIHTIKLRNTHGSNDFYFSGCELIAQDTTSTATKSKIQIPSQNVVSYGKKFTVSGTPHYDPFNGFTNETDNHNTYIDYATSLGTDGWKNGSNYYRPYNGGRVVKWVDSSGTIKTSVTMMPPNAKSQADSSSLTNATAKANASIANNTFYPTFEAHTTSANEDNLSEVAKTFYFREFGNGNQNRGDSGTNKDFSMTNGAADKGYVMDDGLTGLFGNALSVANLAAAIGGQMINLTTGDAVYMNFIGTGITLTITNWDGNANQILTVAQNLPYGTHILKIALNASPTKLQVHVDGIEIWNNASTAWAPSEFTIHQPKMPPISEDACILADYMLMADFVPKTTMDVTKLSKGVRRVSPSRDIFFDEASGGSFALSINSASGSAFKMNIGEVTSGSTHGRLPAFCTNTQVEGYDSDGRLNMTVDGGSAVSTTGTSGGDWGDVSRLTTDLTLGIHTIRQEVDVSASASYMNMTNWDVVTPIHTSSHYQEFETPLLKELIGGDRNMEQTNLVVTPDGKTWDESTRDVSYIGPSAGINVSRDGGNVAAGTTYSFDYFRGTSANGNYYLKGFVPAADRIICLVDGEYRISMMGFTSDSTYDLAWYFKINGTTSVEGSCSGDSTRANIWSVDCIRQLKRGDYLSLDHAVGAIYGGATPATQFSINKIG